MEPPDCILLRRRRRFFILNSLIAGGYAAAGIGIGVSEGDWFGYVRTALSSVAAIMWASRLLIPPEVLLTIREAHFHWFAPDSESASTLFFEMRPPAKSAPALSARTVSCGVWDEELDDTS